MAFSVLTAKLLLGTLIAALPAFSGFFKKEEKIPIVPECVKYKERQAFPCGQEPDPICASDNNTYENYCQFCMFFWRIDSRVKFVHYGFCKTHRSFYAAKPISSNTNQKDEFNLT
ncbi:serine protease inhibitor Kazal-type 9-like [Petaurus breviceps papuanus]|uniref:serine protease inhibitor Kazal-type 9-like n=1 Tax=Petaurus breviceps papuanus TaxID=3040969 RepID=UPI0036DDC4F4